MEVRLYLFSPCPVPTLPSTFGNYLDILNDHLFACYSFEHVPNSETGNIYRSERLHLDSSRSIDIRRCLHRYKVAHLPFAQVEADIDIGQGDGMTQRNEVACLLCSHDSSKLSYSKHISFRPARTVC